MNVDIARACVEFVRHGEGKYEDSGEFKLAAWFQGNWALDLNDFRGVATGRTPRGLREVLEREDCGTAFCVAGYATQLYGNYPIYTSGENWHKLGSVALGITTDEARLLFDGENSREDVLHFFGQIADEHGVVREEIGL